MPTAPGNVPRSREALTSRLGHVLAEASALAAKRDACEAEARRIILKLARLPEFEPPSPPSAAPAWISLKAAARQFGRSPDTLRRHGKREGWAWKAGGRWVCDPEAVSRFMAPSRTRA